MLTQTHFFVDLTELIKHTKCSTYSFANFQLSFESNLGDPEHLTWYFTDTQAISSASDT